MWTAVAVAQLRNERCSADLKGYLSAFSTDTCGRRRCVVFVMTYVVMFVGGWVIRAGVCLTFITYGTWPQASCLFYTITRYTAPILVGLQTEGPYEQWVHYQLFECRKQLSWRAYGFYFLIQLLDDSKSGTLTKKIMLLRIYIYLNWIKKLIAWKRVFGEKQFCRRIPLLLWKPKVDYGDSRSWPYIAVLSQPNLIHTLLLVHSSPVTLVCTNIPI
jgi:hypothetical protein